MMDLTKIFVDFFDDEKHSDAELLRYTTQHIALMNGNNPANVLDARIAATNTAFSAFATCKGDKEFKAAARKSANESKGNFRKNLREPIGKCAAAVEAAFGKPSPDYTACFPNGRDGICEATEDMLLPRMTALHTALSARSAAVGIAAQVTAVNGLKTNWTALLAAADAADSTESGTDAQRKTLRKTMTKELSRNGTFLAFTYIEDLDKAHLLLPQHLLGAAPAPTAPEKPSASGGWNTDDSAAEFEVTSEGATSLRSERSSDGGTTWDNDGPAALGHVERRDMSPGTYLYRFFGINDVGESEASDPVEVVVP
jgi:hypothetical protein